MEIKSDPVITIDSGNTGTKVCVMSGVDCLCSLRTDEPEIESLIPLLEEYPWAPVVYCSVRHIDARFAETLSQIKGEALLIVTSHTPLPIAVDYRTPGTLGADRVASAVGAAALLPDEALLIADAGTALTLDVVTPNPPAFRGGNISAGIRLRLEALHRFTSALPQVGPDGEVPLFGFDTDTALRSGAIRGIVAETEQAFRRARHTYGASRLLLCGGDAPYILPHLSDEVRPLTIHQPRLLELGLTCIYHYNENN